MYSHRAPEGIITASIWTHGECLRLVTVKPGFITVWEVGFTSTHMPTEIESLPTPGDISDSEDLLFLPTLSRLAFVHRGKVLIWDGRNSKLLLDSPLCNSGDMGMSFCSDGRFFACASIMIDQGTFLWKESSAGYVLHRQLVSGIKSCARPLLSPDGESIITSMPYETQLWRTTDPISSSSVPARGTWEGHFILEFSPDGLLAATARMGGKMATVLDLKSGNPRLTIDTGVAIYGLRVTGNAVVVVGGEMIITWNLPAGDHVLDVRATINDSARTATLNNLTSPRKCLQTARISPDLGYVVFTREGNMGLDIYDVSTGNHLAGTAIEVQELQIISLIVLDGCEVWDLDGLFPKGWKIIKDENSHVIGLELLPKNTKPSGRYPWRSPHGHGITDDGWIFNSTEKLLMWLPQRWRIIERVRRWDGQFLGLVDWTIPDPVIIELCE